jgi:hypothetical protein
MSPHSRILFPRPSFFEGLGRIFDFAGALSLYNISRTPEEADVRALNSDWAATADDLWAGLEAADKEFQRERELTERSR